MRQPPQGAGSGRSDVFGTGRAPEENARLADDGVYPEPTVVREMRGREPAAPRGDLVGSGTVTQPRRRFPAEPGQWAFPLGEEGDASGASQALAWTAVLVMAAAATALAALGHLAAVRAGFDNGLSESLMPFLGLLALGVIGDGLRERSREDEIELSFTAVILLAAIPLTGPIYATILGPLILALSPLAYRLRQHTRAASGLPHRTLLVFAVNATMTAFVTAAGACVYLMTGGVHLDDVEGGADVFTHVGFPLLLADLSFTVLNAVLVAVMIASTPRAPVRAFVTGALPVSVLLYLGYSVIAFLLLVLWGPVGLGAVALLLILAPLIILRWSYREYVEEKEVHRRLLEALALSGELRRDQVSRPYRISRLCAAIATEMGLSSRDHDVLRDASALHDVGTIAVPWPVLEADPATLTETELDRLASHPRVSHDLLSGIDFLEGSAEAVLYHHERFDGLGYPSGLTGADIPAASRVLACADLAEALGQVLPPTPRGWKRLIDGLRFEAGHILDPQVVDAAVRVLTSTRSAEFYADLMTRESRRGGHRSHALPSTSDLLAVRQHGKARSTPGPAEPAGEDRVSLRGASAADGSAQPREGDDHR